VFQDFAQSVRIENEFFSLISETPLIADNLLTTIWKRISRISADNPAGRFGHYNAASI
jgi:hypothetical protein